MALACALLGAGRPLLVAHVNYALRGADSDGDERRVVAWCETHGVPFEVLRPDVMEVTAVRGNGMQEAARHLRYGWFAELAREHRADFVATGHHADDQAETVLLQLIRSANPLAAAGMPGRRPLVAGDGEDGSGPVLIRPLLGWTKSALQDALKAGGLEWRDDATNQSDAYLRNRIRMEVMPALEAVRAGTVGHLATWAARLAGLRDFIEDAQAAAMARCWNGTDLNLAVWRTEPLAGELLHRVAAEWGLGATAVSELSQLAGENARTGSRFISRDVMVTRERALLHFQSKPQAKEGMDSETVVIARPSRAAPLKIDLPLHLTGVFAPAPADWSEIDANQCWLDADALEWPLTVRPWKNGDAIAPRGMNGSQKVSDLLTQSKVPSHSRSGFYVMQSADGVLLWVVGLRTSRHAEIGTKTASPWCLTLHPPT